MKGFISKEKRRTNIDSTMIDEIISAEGKFINNRCNLILTYHRRQDLGSYIINHNLQAY